MRREIRKLRTWPKGGLVVGKQVELLSGEAPKIARADRGVVEAMIGHTKAEGLLGRNWLKGAEGDALHALLCGAGHNLRMTQRHLRVLYCVVFGLITRVVSLLRQLLTPSLLLDISAAGKLTRQRG